MFLFPQAGLITIALLNLIIGSWVLYKNPRNIINRSFFVFVLGISSWILGVTLLYFTHDFIYDSLALGGGLLTFFGMSLFAYVFPSRIHISRKFLFFLMPLGIALVCVPFHLFIRGIAIDSQGLVEPINGTLFPLYGLLGVVYFIFTPLYLFRRNYAHANAKARMQMKYLGAGVLFFVIGSISCDVFFPALGIYEFNTLGPATSIVFILLTSYAIVRHQLMDIRVIIQRGAIYSLLLSLLISIYLCLLYLSESFFDQYEEITTPIFAGIVMLVGIVTIPSIEHYFQRITDRFFFKDHYDYAKSLEELSAILNVNIHFTDMLTDLLSKLSAILRPENIEFIYTSTGKAFALSGSKLLQRNPQPILEDDTRVLITARKRTIGTFVLGRKRSGDSYTSEDLGLLRTFAGLASVAFEKAELYQRLQEYSKSLEQKVHARTEKLEQMQQDQRQLFDDISHALQTPLTILKGAIELFKNEQEIREVRAIESMEYSVDDLSRLIREILQLARIDASPIQEDRFTLIDLSSLVESVVEYVEIVCQQNHIAIVARVTPGLYIMGNQKQIEEVMTNLLSNAVHYTALSKVRKITVSLKKQEKSIELRIADTGAGIEPDRLPHIFDRFYRGHDRDHAERIGYGLGLAIVKRLVERHAGTVHAESVVEKGTDMIIHFPEPITEVSPVVG